jgi:hypothetical protein
LKAPALGLVFNSLSPFWLLLEAVWIAVGAVLLGVAYRAKSEWVKAAFATLGLAILGWHILAVLPSWWLYYADGVLGWGGNGCTNIDVSAPSSSGSSCGRRSSPSSSRRASRSERRPGGTNERHVQQAPLL